MQQERSIVALLEVDNMTARSQIYHDRVFAVNFTHGVIQAFLQAIEEAKRVRQKISTACVSVVLESEVGLIPAEVDFAALWPTYTLRAFDQWRKNWKSFLGGLGCFPIDPASPEWVELREAHKLDFSIDHTVRMEAYSTYAVGNTYDFESKLISYADLLALLCYFETNDRVREILPQLVKRHPRAALHLLQYGLSPLGTPEHERRSLPLGSKEVLMPLFTHESSDIREHAIVAAQKIALEFDHSSQPKPSYLKKQTNGARR